MRLVTAPNDKEQSIPVLQSAHEAGIPVLTVDTFIGDGNYADGEVTFPLTYIGSDNVQWRSHRLLGIWLTNLAKARRFM